jgi:hypothetical protein
MKNNVAVLVILGLVVATWLTLEDRFRRSNTDSCLATFVFILLAFFGYLLLG